MIFLDPNKKTPMYEQLFRELRKEILNHNLEEDEKLKSIRQFAHEIGVSFNTVNRTYQMLLAEGYIRAVPGSGFYVEPLHLHQDHRTQTEISFPKKPAAEKILYDFRYDVFERDTFPWNKWRKYINNAITEQYYQKNVSYIENKGGRALRESLASYMLHSRGITCDPDQIVVAPGTQYLMDIISGILPKKKYRVGVEEPGYNGMRQVFLNKSFSLQPIPVTETGIDANQLEKTGCNLLYLTPSHQFPTGVTLPLIKRIQILEWARRNDAYVIENDYDNEFLYGKTAQPPMFGIDRNDIVIYISALTKVMTPEIRCAYAVIPKKLMAVYDEKYRYYYAALSACDQRALADFINDGNLDRQIRKITVRNAKKKEIIDQIFQTDLSGIIRYSKEAAGSHMIITAAVPHPEKLEQELMRHGIRIYSISPYFYCREEKNRHKNQFLFGYGAIPVSEIEDACREFVRVIKNIILEG